MGGFGLRLVSLDTQPDYLHLVVWCIAAGWLDLGVCMHVPDAGADTILFVDLGV